MTSTGLASGCPPWASFSSRSFNGVWSAMPGCSVIHLPDHVADPCAIPSQPMWPPLLLCRGLLLRRSLAGGCPLDRSLGALFRKEFHSLFARQFLQGGS